MDMRQIWISLVLVGLVGCGGVSADMAAPSMSGDMGGVTTDGGQDAGYFRGLLLSGAIPRAEDIELQGFISEHDIQFSGDVCDQVICLSALIGHDEAVAEQGRATFIQLAMASNVDLESRPRTPVNLAVVVDVSGSMSSNNKLDYVKQGLLLMLDELDAEDQLALVTYSSTARVIVPSQYVTDRSVFTEAIQALYPSGSTNLYDGMVLGYQEVAKNLESEGLARVMLLSDGLANVGTTDDESILATSAEYNRQGIGLTTIGVGLDFNQELMLSLAEQGNGNFYFVETQEKITKVFKDELDFLITPLAHNLDIVLTLADGFDLVDVHGLAYEWDEDGNMVVHVPTVFASRRGGAILIRVDSTDAIGDLEGEVVTSIAYAYEPLDADGTVLAQVSDIVDARVPAVNEDGVAYDAPGVHKSLVVWNMVESFHAASNAYHVDYDQWAALDHIERLAAYVERANLVLDDEELARDRSELINQFAINLGGWLGDPWFEGDDPMMMNDCCWDDVDEGPMLFPFGCATTPGASVPLLLAGLALLLRRR
jgi:Ca-activated chloride channel family protein